MAAKRKTPQQKYERARKKPARKSAKRRRTYSTILCRRGDGKGWVMERRLNTRGKEFLTGELGI